MASAETLVISDKSLVVGVAAEVTRVVAVAGVVFFGVVDDSASSKVVDGEVGVCFTGGATLDTAVGWIVDNTDPLQSLGVMVT
jgi:hypothetical protein